MYNRIQRETTKIYSVEKGNNSKPGMSNWLKTRNF